METMKSMPSAVSINLASEPFRRDRPIVLAGIAGGTLLGGLLLFQAALIWTNRETTIEARQDVATQQGRLQSLARDRATLEGTLRQPANSAALEESLFFNALLRRKGISWSRVFSDLETVLPFNVRLVSVRPQVNQYNQIVLEMAVASATTEPVIQMLMRLEGSPVFGATAVQTWLPPSQNEPNFRYTVKANYAPRL
jgi:Tfp pilus assembly protein PilN